MQQGYVYVGVTTQYAGVQTLTACDSGCDSRDASLFHPCNSYCYDIFSQAGWVTTHARNGDPRPLGDLTDRVRAVIATGFSRYCGRTNVPLQPDSAHIRICDEAANVIQSQG